MLHRFLMKKGLIAFLFMILVFVILTHQTQASNQPWDGNVNTKLAALEFKAPGLPSKVLRMALLAYSRVNEKGLAHKPYLTVIDYRIPSNKKRMWIFNLNSNRLLYHTFVAHGKGSGELNATQFSNEPGSRETSLGVFVTEDTYDGHNGLSLHLNGLEKGFNSNAERRMIVVHGAPYVGKDVIATYHRSGLSWGCPAVPENLARPIINTIKRGSVIFSYYPDNNWLRHSAYLT